MKTLDDLRQFKRKDPDEFYHCLDLCKDNLEFLKREFGFNFHSLRYSIPTKIQLKSQFFSFFGKKAIDLSLTRLFEYFQKALEREKAMQQDPLEWDKDMEKKQYLIRSGYLEKYKQGLVARECLIDFLENRNIIKIPKTKIKDHLKIKKQAYILFIDQGKDKAREYLEEHKIRKKVINFFINQFQDKLDQFTGKSCLVSTSEFEKTIEKELIESGIFFRRQVPYKEITDTDKAYRMDFLVGSTIIEVVGIEDLFIHTQSYWKRLKEKKRLAEKTDKSFLIITEADDHKQQLNEAVQKAFIPEKIYNLMDLQEIKQIQPNFPFKNTSDKRIYFCNNLFMKGYMRKRIA